MVCRALVGGVLSVISATCWSLSLGQFTGQAILGKGLDIRIPLKLAAQESANDLCPVVKVFFAEEAVPSAQLDVSVRSLPDSGSAELRVTTRAILNEPYARIDVVAGCSNQFSRQYTVLADLPPVDVPAPARSVMIVTPPTAGLPSIQQRASADSSRPHPFNDSREDVGKPAPVKPVRTVQRNTSASESSAQRTSKPKDAEPAVPGARLKLDPVELVSSLVQLAPSLRLESGSFSGSDAPVSPDLQARRDAARALWLAMNETPEQAATNAAKTSTAGAESQGLKVQLSAARQAEVDLQAALEAEREAIYTRPIVLSLAGGLVLALGGLALFWHRVRSSDAGKQPWWKRPIGKSAASDGLDKPPSALKTAMRKIVPKAKSTVDIDVDTLFPPDPAAEGLPTRSALSEKSRAQGPTTIGGPEFLASSLMDGSRAMATEELFDLQQQVEFFVSLGQSEQAVDVLVNHLSDSLEPSPLAYLDLLRLYHDLDRRADYETLRKDFNRLFSGSAPAFDDYSHSRRGLERYEAALSRIQHLWPQPAVLDVIERSIFRQSSNNDVEVFDLEAYRELLLLYGIAREVIAPESAFGSSSEGPPSLFGSLDGARSSQTSGTTVLQPLVAQTRESRERSSSDILKSGAGLAVASAAEAVRQPEDSSGLDLDLSLDIELPSGDPVIGNATGTKTVFVSPPESMPDAMSFDLSDSMFDSLPEVDQKPQAPDIFAPAPAINADVSLDFSGLDRIDGLTIKKSGVQS